MNIINKKIALETIKSRYFVWPVLFFSIVLFLIVIGFSNIQDKHIFPNSENYNYNYYTDNANGGNSQVLSYSVTDTAIKLKFNLQDGFLSPYVGLGITPKIKGYLNAAWYNQIRLSIKGNAFNRLGVTIITPSYFSREILESDEIVYSSNVNITSKKAIHYINFNQLGIPEWWKEQHNMARTQIIKPNFKNILNINIGTAYTPNTKKDMSLAIYAISFTRDNRKLYLSLGILAGLYILLLFTIIYLIGRKKHETNRVTVLYKPIEIDNTNPIKTCFEFINQNFQNSNLSLEQISRETGIAQRRITNSIQAEFNCNIKTYINRIRINESKRFLSQTNLNIGEIAFKVGFNNQSHFNRVFKNELGISPSAYREKNRG